MIIEAPLGLYKYGTLLQKKQGSHWRGKVVGYYSTSNTPIGYAIESAFEPGSVQIYPASALVFWDPTEK
jgi:dihydrofolate reductase (trimethoprim resistance protein)